MSDAESRRIKDYQHWSIFLHENQSYLGRCVVWCNREDALDLADATIEEQLELFQILSDLRSVAQRAFGADWVNYAFLGNFTRHLHCHFIPRYESERQFAGMTFKDDRWGRNYRTDENFITPLSIIDAITMKIKEKLG